MEVIIKYPKSKFYSLTTKKYVNLDYIGKLIDEGENVFVEDFKTKADLTGLITLKAIVAYREGLVRNGTHKIKKSS